MPSVVNIATSRPESLIETFNRRFSNVLSDPRTGEKREIGSGVIIEQVENKVFILTNLHVVDRATRIQVQLWDGRIYEAERLIWTTQKDLVLLKIMLDAKDTPVKRIQFAKDDDLLLGETVIAVGNAYGIGGSVSRGILSSKNRRTMSGNAPLNYADWLQTDADINPGNSGGALINLRGELIGINVAIYEGEEGTGLRFAIPVRQISSALSDFFSLEYASSLWLGAKFSGTQLPLTVRYVQPGSPADHAGLREGQQVLAVNGVQADGLVKFSSLVTSGADRRVKITVSDNGKKRELQADLITLADLMRFLFQSKLGLKTQELNHETAVSLTLKPNQGLLVSEVESNSPAQTAGLRSGIVLVAVEGRPIVELANAAPALGNKKAGESVNLSVLVPQTINGSVVGLQQGTVAITVR